MRRKRASEFLWRLVWDRDGGKCVYCRVPLVRGTHTPPGQREPGNTATLDHIKPHSQGGFLKVGNVVLACRSCNNKRGAMPAHEFCIWRERNPTGGLGKRERKTK